MRQRRFEKVHRRERAFQWKRVEGFPSGAPRPERLNSFAQHGNCDCPTVAAGVLFISEAAGEKSLEARRRMGSGMPRQRIVDALVSQRWR